MHVTTTSNESSSSDITRLLGSTLKFATYEYIKPSIVGKDTIKYSVEVVKKI